MGDLAGEDSGFSRNVFINCPFDAEYRNLFRAIVFTVQISGLRPRCSLEDSNVGEARLDKIIRIIQECKFGIHDICRTDLDPANHLPRFNMPFELGLDLACSRYGNDQQRAKKLMVLDSEKYRYQKYISDISGCDIFEHSCEERKVIHHVRDWLRTVALIRPPGSIVIVPKFQEFIQQFPEICNQQGLDPDNIAFADHLEISRAWLEVKS